MKVNFYWQWNPS